MKTKCFIIKAWKFSLLKIECIVARRPKKLKLILVNFLYVKSKGDNICQLNHDIMTKVFLTIPLGLDCIKLDQIGHHII